MENSVGRRRVLKWWGISSLGAWISSARSAAAQTSPGAVRCANLIYADGKTSVCFSDEFLEQLGRESFVRTDQTLHPVALQDPALYEFPLAVMTGEGEFHLSGEQQAALRTYLEQGGFIIASAGCSNPAWANSFRREIREVFPELELIRIPPNHAIYHCLYKIPRLDLGKSAGQTHLEGLEIDGKIGLIFSPDGLNDTGKVGGNCCCCGGNEIKNARLVNCNLVAYALTH